MSTIDALLGGSQSQMDGDAHLHSLFPNNFAALCFDRSEFNRPDFNVDAFLAKARRRGATLEQIRDDARVYLKIIQNSMIELINKDYADFVHLSSNLAGLRGAVEKLDVETDEMTTEFEQTASKIKAAVEDLAKETEEKRRLSTEQRHMEKRIIALSTLERLKKFLSSNFLMSSDGDGDSEKDFEAIQRASYLIEELQSIKSSCSGLKTELHPNFDKALASVLDHFQKWLESKFTHSVQNSDRLLLVFVLRGYAACDRLDAAQAVFLAQFVEPELRSSIGGQKKQKSVGKVEQLKSLLDQVLVVRNRYRSVFATDAISSGRVSDFISELDESSWKLTASFLDDCLLTALLSALQDRFGPILIPTDAATFRKAYRCLTAFAEEWSTTSGSNKIMKMIFDKFSIVIYYQLCYHELTSSIDANLASMDEILPAGKNELFSLKSTSFVHAKLLSIWSSIDDESVFLQPLAPKFWELTCMIINRYGRHISEYVENFQKPTEHENLLSNGEKSTTPKRASTPIMPSASQHPHTSNLLILYASDLRVLECQVCTNVLARLLDQCRIEGDMLRRSLERCLKETFSNLRQKIDQAIADAMIPWLTSQVSSQLASVAEVPRQYRWTRKEAPTQPSPYLATALDPIRRVLQTSSEKLPNDTRLITGILERVLSSVVASYTENLKSVSDSVEKISSSLSRLKTKGGGGRTGSMPDNMSAVTDEQKIRLQLRLDVEEFEKMVNNFQPPVVCDLSEMKHLVASNAAGNEA